VIFSEATNFEKEEERRLMNKMNAFAALDNVSRRGLL
jgi:hypothetical protein